MAYELISADVKKDSMSENVLCTAYVKNGIGKQTGVGFGALEESVAQAVATATGFGGDITVRLISKAPKARAEAVLYDDASCISAHFEHGNAYTAMAQACIAAVNDYMKLIAPN